MKVAPGFINYKKGALDSQPQVIKFTSCLPTKTGRHDIAEILLKVALKHKKSINQSYTKFLVVLKVVKNISAMGLKRF
jgi:hypothetical protein